MYVGEKPGPEMYRGGRYISFNARAISLILKKKKTQVRKVVTPSPPKEILFAISKGSFHSDLLRIKVDGDRCVSLRSEIAQCGNVKGWSSRAIDSAPGKIQWVKERYRHGKSGNIVFEADLPEEERISGIWYSSRQMSQRISRMKIKVKSVHPEFLHDISNLSMEKEGFSSIDHFRLDWDSRYRYKIHKWRANPVVWVINFRLHVVLNRKTWEWEKAS